MINRVAVEARLARVIYRPRGAPDAAEAFLPEAAALICEHFDACGWPKKMPNLVALPPHQISSDPLHQRGYAGIGYHGEPDAVLWRQNRKGEPFLKVDPKEEFNLEAAP